MGSLRLGQNNGISFLVLGKNRQNFGEGYPLIVRPLLQTVSGFFTDDRGQWKGFKLSPLTDLVAATASPFCDSA